MIRIAKISDIEAISELKLRMFEESGHINMLCKDAKSLIESEYIKMYTEQKAVHFIEEVNGKVVSCTGAFIKSDIPYCFFKTPFYGFIGDVYTLPEYRGNGYATELTKAAINWLREKGVERVSLLASEQARGIYGKIGFQPTDEMAMFIK